MSHDCNERLQCSSCLLKIKRSEVLPLDDHIMIEPHPKALEMIDGIVALGIWGRTREEVVLRWTDEALQRLSETPVFDAVRR